MNEKKYTGDGYLIVSESDKCPLWEKTTRPCLVGCTNDCFYCRYSDFRTPDFIRNAENMPRTDKWYSKCHNEKNKKVTPVLETCAERIP